MAWEHFTTWLQPGDIVTKAMHTELYAAAIERWLAAYGFDPDNLTNFASAAVYTLSAQDTYGLIGSLLSLGVRYVNDDIFDEALADLGLPPDTPKFVRRRGTVPTHIAYNLARRIIQVMRTIRLQGAEVGSGASGVDTHFSESYASYGKRAFFSDGNASWASLVADFMAAPETSGGARETMGGARSLPGDEYDGYIQLRGGRSEIQFAFPALPVYTRPVDLGLAVLIADDPPTPDSLEVSGDFTASQDVTQPGTYTVPLASGIAPAPVSLNFQLLSYTDSAKAGGYDPVFDGELRKWMLVTPLVTPTFTHPYEEMSAGAPF